MTAVATDKSTEAPNIKTSKNSAASKIAEACKVSDERFKIPRENRTDWLKRFAGPYYHRKQEQGAIKPRPINTFHWLVSTFLPSVAPEGDVLADVTSPMPQLRPFADLFRLALNVVYREMDLGGTFVQTFTDAMFGPSIIYVGLEMEPPGDREDFQNYLQDPGVPFAERISFDKYVLDPYCMVREAANFEGHDFMIAQRDAYEAGYDKKVLEKMDITRYEGKQLDTAAEMSRAGILKDKGDQYVPQFQMRQVMLYRERIIVTIPTDPNEAIGFLAEADYDEGDERGPYELLAFQPVPDNAIPLSKLGIVADLDETMNIIATTIRNQAERSKTVLAYSGTAEDDAMRVTDTADGQSVRVSDITQLKEFTFGGVDPRAYEPMGFFADWQNKIAGNPNLASGGESGEDTLGQTQMMMGQVGDRLGFDRSIANKFAKRVAKKIARYVWTDPLRMMQLSQRVGSTDIPTEWTPTHREGSFEDYQVGVDVYSMRPDNPEARYQRTMEVIERAYIPFAGLAAQQGVLPKIPELLKEAGKLRNLPELDGILSIGNPIEQPAPVQSETKGVAGGRMQAGGPSGGRPAPQAVPVTKESADGQ